MGILANDGDHPLFFGDYRYGSISERLLFATKPGGKDSDFYLAVAGDLVYRDNNARLTRGDQALQAVLAAFWEKNGNKFGVFSTARHQENDRELADLDSHVEGEERPGERLARESEFPQDVCEAEAVHEAEDERHPGPEVTAVAPHQVVGPDEHDAESDRGLDDRRRRR